MNENSKLNRNDGNAHTETLSGESPSLDCSKGSSLFARILPSLLPCIFIESMLEFFSITSMTFFKYCAKNKFFCAWHAPLLARPAAVAFLHTAARSARAQFALNASCVRVSDTSTADPAVCGRKRTHTHTRIGATRLFSFLLFSCSLQ